MKIHEYQGKEILRASGIPVPRGDIASSPQAARQVAETLGGNRWVVKAQDRHIPQFAAQVVGKDIRCIRSRCACETE